MTGCPEVVQCGPLTVHLNRPSAEPDITIIPFALLDHWAIREAEEVFAGGIVIRWRGRSFYLASPLRVANAEAVDWFNECTGADVRLSSHCEDADWFTRQLSFPVALFSGVAHRYYDSELRSVFSPRCLRCGGREYLEPITRETLSRYLPRKYRRWQSLGTQYGPRRLEVHGCRLFACYKHVKRVAKLFVRKAVAEWKRDMDRVRWQIEEHARMQSLTRLTKKAVNSLRKPDPDAWESLRREFAQVASSQT